jgi:hypothetical protein
MGVGSLGGMVLGVGSSFRLAGNFGMVWSRYGGEVSENRAGSPPKSPPRETE